MAKAKTGKKPRREAAMAFMQAKAAPGGFALAGHPWAPANGVYKLAGTRNGWPLFRSEIRKVNRVARAMELTHYSVSELRACGPFTGEVVEEGCWAIEDCKQENGRCYDSGVACLPFQGGMLPMGAYEWECLVPPVYPCGNEQRCTLTLSLQT